VILEGLGDGGYAWITCFDRRSLSGEVVMISIIACIITCFLVRPGWFEVFCLIAKNMVLSQIGPKKGFVMPQIGRSPKADSKKQWQDVSMCVLAESSRSAFAAGT
jgi:hypothetical protein